MRLQQQSTKIIGLHFPVLFSFGKSLDGSLRNVHRRMIPYFQDKMLWESKT